MLIFFSGFGFITVTIAGSSFLGRKVLGKREIFSDAFLQSGLQIAIGSLLISYAVFTLACLQAISSHSLKLLFTIVSVLAVFEITSFFLPWLARTIKPPKSFLAAFGLMLLSTPMLWIILQTILPPSDRDELIYHLAVPKEILANGGFKLFQDNIYAYFPQLGEMFFLSAMGVLGRTGGEIASKLHHLSFGFLLMLTLYGYTRPHFPKKYSLLAIIVLMSTPSVMTTLPLAYVDLTFAFYAFLALILLQKFIETPNFSLSILLGLLSGSAAATKYTGISYVAILFCLLLIYQFVNRGKSYLRYIPVFLAASVAVFLPYLIRNFYFTGWPLFPFPFLGQEIHGGINWDLNRATLFMQFLTSFGARIGERSFLHDALSPLLVFLTGKFNTPEHFDGVLGPIFLLTPFLLWKKIAAPQIKFLLSFAVVFLFYWVCTTKQVRFLFPLLPVLCFLIAYGVYQSKNKRAWLAILLPLILFNISQGFSETLQKYPFAYLSGKESRQNYLARQWDGLAAYFEANERLAGRDRIYLIHMKNYVYYLDCPWRADFIFERFTLENILENSRTPTDALTQFTQRGISHILVDEEFIRSSRTGLEGQSKELFNAFLSQESVEIKRFKQFSLRQLHPLK